MLTEAEEEAKIVRKIFSLALEGKTSVEIARLLNLEKIPAPIEFKIKKKQADRTPQGNSFRWNHTAVCSILKNPVYTGDINPDGGGGLYAAPAVGIGHNDALDVFDNIAAGLHPTTISLKTQEEPSAQNVKDLPLFLCIFPDRLFLDKYALERDRGRQEETR